MAETFVTSLGNLRRFNHKLDSMTPFVLYEGVRKKEYYTDKPVGDIHLDPQLFIILSGETEFFLDDVSFTGTAGDIFISNFWEPHAFRISSPELHFLSITFSMFSFGNATPFADFDWYSFMKKTPSRRKISFAEKEKKEVLHLVEKIIELEKNTPSGYRSMQYFLIHEIIFYINSSCLSDAPANRDEQNQARIFPALELIRRNPNCEIPLDEAAKVCSMSRSTFCQKFKETMNESFSHFAMKKRIGYSCMLLHLNQHTIKEISDQCGFKNITHFYHVFKKFRQCTPQEFITGNHFDPHSDEEM